MFISNTDFLLLLLGHELTMVWISWCRKNNAANNIFDTVLYTRGFIKKCIWKKKNQHITINTLCIIQTCSFFKIYFFCPCLWQKKTTKIWSSSPDLLCHAGRRAWNFLANNCPACSLRLWFSLRNSLASSFATVRHRLSVLPRTHPLCCPGNRLDVGSGGGGGGGRAGAVRVCVARCYRELT